MKATLLGTLHLSSPAKTTDTFDRNKLCHMALDGLSSICAELEPANSEKNETLEINVLQKGPVKPVKWVKIAHSFYSLCQIRSMLS